MMLPIPDVLELERLRANGVNELAINLELFGDGARRRLIPEKNALADRDQSLAFIEKAVRVFGGRVRSLVLVGAEPLEDTLNAIQALAERGCEPVLSPFCPHPSTPMAAHPSPSADQLAEAYERASEVASRNGMRLGPKCVPCQHNTLTFPDDSGYYSAN
jgi:biotin synthase-related radical SAM superfamily protein